MPKCNSHTDLVAGGLSLLERFAFLYMQAPRNKPNTHIKKDMQVFEYRSWEIENIYVQIYIYCSITINGGLEKSRLYIITCHK